MQKRILFLDGSMVPASKTFIQTLAPSILSGRGVFETMRAYNGGIFALDKHLSRLEKGLKRFKIKLPCPKKRIKEYLYLTLRSNKLKNARLRLTVWQVKKNRRISIITIPYRPLSRSKYRQGFKAVISDIKRDEEFIHPEVKSINYFSLMMARRKAKIKGNDEAVLLNKEGYLAEGSYTNIFLVKAGKLYTPSLLCGCLDGITRQYVIELAKDLKIECKERKIPPEELLGADEAFLTSSLIEIMPLTCVQGKFIGKGEMGPITKILLKGYAKLVKEAQSYSTPHGK